MAEDLTLDQQKAIAVASARMRAASENKGQAPSSWDVGVNAINKAIAGTADMFLNAPNELWNLGKAGVGTALTASGHPELAPDLTQNPDLTHQVMVEAGFIRPEWEPVTPAQKAEDVLVQGGTMGALTGGRSIPETALSSGLGALSLGSQAAVQKLTGNLPLAISAGLAVPAGAARVATPVESAGKAVKDVLSPERAAGKKIAEAMHAPGESRKALREPPSAISPRTLAQVTREPGLASFEMTGKELPESKGRFKAREAEQASARAAALEGAIPGEAQPSVIGRASEQVIGKIMRAIARRREAATSAEQAAKQSVESWSPDSMSLGASVSAEQFGSVVRSQLEAERTQAKQAIEARTAPLRQEALSSPAEVNLGAVIDRAKALAQKIKGQPNVESALSVAVNNLKRFSKPRPVESLTHEEKVQAVRTGEVPSKFSSTMEQAYNARKYINDLMEGRTADPTARFADRQLRELRDALDEQMNAASDGKWQEYLNSYKEAVRVLDPFSRIRGKVPLTLKTDEFGNTYAYEPEEVAGMFLTPGDKGAAYARQLKGLISAKPEFTGALKGYIAGKIKSVIDRGGNVQKNLESWIRDYGPALKEYGLYDQVSNPVKARSMMEDNLASSVEKKRALFQRMDQREQAANKSALAKLIGGDPDRTFSMLLNSKNAEGNLRQLVELGKQNPQVMSAIRTQVRDFVFDRRTAGYDYAMNPRESFAKQMTAWNKYKPMLSRSGLYTPEQIKVMDEVFKDIERQQYVTKEGVGAGVSPTTRFGKMAQWMHNRMMYALTSHMGSMIAGGSAFAFGGFTGLAGAMGTVEYLNYIKNATTEQLIKATLDPKVAAELVKQYDMNRALILQPIADRAAQAAAESLAAYVNEPQKRP